MHPPRCVSLSALTPVLRKGACWCRRCPVLFDDPTDEGFVLRQQRFVLCFRKLCACVCVCVRVYGAECVVPLACVCGSAGQCVYVGGGGAGTGTGKALCCGAPCVCRAMGPGAVCDRRAPPPALGHEPGMSRLRSYSPREIRGPLRGTPPEWPLPLWGGVPCAVHALCARCAKSWPFPTTGSSVSSEAWKDVIEWLLQWTGL